MAPIRETLLVLDIAGAALHHAIGNASVEPMAGNRHPRAAQALNRWLEIAIRDDHRQICGEIKENLPILLLPRKIQNFGACQKLGGFRLGLPPVMSPWSGPAGWVQPGFRFTPAHPQPAPALEDF